MKSALVLAFLLLGSQLGVVLPSLPSVGADIPAQRAVTLVVRTGGFCPYPAPFCFNGTVPGPQIAQGMTAKTVLNVTLFNEDSQNHTFTLPSPYHVYILAKPNNNATIRIGGMTAGNFTYRSNMTGDAPYLYGNFYILPAPVYWTGALDQFALFGVILTIAGVVYILSRARRSRAARFYGV